MKTLSKSIKKISFLQYRQLIIQLIVHDLKARYSTSFLGGLWVILIPLSTLAIYTFVFSVILPPAWQDEKNAPYVFILFAALIPYTFFSEVINRSPIIILGYPNYVKKVVFPLQILPIVILGGAFVDSLISILMMLAGMLIFLHGIPMSVLLLPVVYVPLVLITIGLSWFIASLGVYIRDLGPAIGIITRLLFFLTPIVYPLSQVPARYLWIIKLNPLSIIVESFRSVLLAGSMLNWFEWSIWTVIGLIIAVMGYYWFMKTRNGFADVI